MANFYLEITPQSNSFFLHWRELWMYRDLIWLFVRRDFVALYKQTILGPIWFFIQPIFTTIVFTVIFGSVGGLNPTGVPSFLYYLAGIVLWNYFSETLLKTSNTFIENQHLFGKVYFPRLTVPISIVISNLLKMGVQFVLFIGVFLMYYLKGQVQIQFTILLFPLLLFLLAILGMGTGIFISAVTTKYRDLRFLVQFGVQLLMYVTPGIILSYDMIVQRFPKFSWIADLNPLYPIIETFKNGWLSAGTFSWESLFISAVIALLTLLISVGIFNRTEQNFMDTV